MEIVKDLTYAMEQAIKDEDFDNFNKAHYKLINIIRVIIFEKDKMRAKKARPHLSRLLAKFFRSNSIAWDDVKVIRLMGGIEVLDFLLSELQEVKTYRELREIVEEKYLREHILARLDEEKFLDTRDFYAEALKEVEILIGCGLLFRVGSPRKQTVILSKKGKDFCDRYFEIVI
jgi:hypothetical protein